MSILKPLIFSGLAGGLLTACSVENCGDPSQDSLGTALNCTVNSAGYQAQTDALSAELSQKRTLAADLRAENARLQGELATLTAAQRQAANRLINVNNQIAALDDQLNSQLGQQSISQAEYDLAQSQLSDLNSRRSSVRVTNPADTARLATLESEVADLRSLF